MAVQGERRGRVGVKACDLQLFHEERGERVTCVTSEVGLFVCGVRPKKDRVAVALVTL